MVSLAFDFDARTLPDEVAQRIAFARRAGTMSNCEADVLDLLADCVTGPCLGRDKALQISAMQDIWTRRGAKVWPERAVKESAKTLLEVYGIPVGSSRLVGHAGYYLIKDDSEAESTVRVWGAEIRSLARRCKALSPKSSYVRGLLGQISAEMEAEL